MWYNYYALQLTPEVESDIFKRLAYKSTLEVGLEFKFDNYYKDNSAIRNAVMNIYRRIKDNPAKYGLEEQTKEIVLSAMAHRNIAGSRVEISKAEKEIETENIASLTSGVRDKAWRLIDRKLTRVSKSKKALDQVSFRDLGTIAGIAFDKTQILTGQATENVAMIAKIDGNIDPNAALDLVLKMREANVAQHESKKK